MKPDDSNLFNINTVPEFNRAALDIFHYQSTKNKVYRRFLHGLKTDPHKISKIEQIPYLPIEFFKTHQVITDSENLNPAAKIFTSSGTSGQIQSKHYVSDIKVYEKSFRKGFDYFYVPIEDYCILALLPSYLERQGSSLIYMADDLIKQSKHPDSGFYLHNYDELISKLKQLKAKKQKTILLGVTYALLDIAEHLAICSEVKVAYDSLIVMETGGMKGKRAELVREELHLKLCEGFGVEKIHSEYGMTELLSQAYSKGNGIFYCPPWMKVIIRDTNDPFSFLSSDKTGGINIIDLANINSCSFIATQDLGKTFPDGSFEVLGRFDNSDLRGCNMLVE